MQARLLHASQIGNIKAVKQILIKAKESNVYEKVLHARNYAGYTPLHLAVVKTNKEVINHLLKNDFSANTYLNEIADTNDYKESGYQYEGMLKGRTPLMSAAISGDLSIVEKLVENKAEVDAVCDRSCTAVWYAAQNGSLQALRCLMKQPKNVREGTAKRKAERKGFQGRSPLGEAASRGETSVVECLIEEFNVDKDHQEDNGYTPLMRAVENNHCKTAEYLLKAGADSTRKARNKKDADSIAIDNDNQHLMKLLGRKPNLLSCRLI